MKKLIVLVGIIAVALLSACSSEESLETLGLEDYNAKDLLVDLKNETLNPSEYAVSVYPDRLVVITEDQEFTMDMPEDEFYLSVAPYVTRTHDCFYHSATGCQGELTDVVFTVLFVTSDGDVLIDEEMNSGENGFVDLWLPRDIEGTLSITYDGLSVSKEISTTLDDATCETTMQLQ